MNFLYVLTVIALGTYTSPSPVTIIEKYQTEEYCVEGMKSWEATLNKEFNSETYEFFCVKTPDPSDE